MPPAGPRGGVLELGLSSSANTPSKGGVLDLGLLRMSKTPSKGGFLDLGFPKPPDPGPRGGGLESDVSIRITHVTNAKVSPLAQTP